MLSPKLRAWLRGAVPQVLAAVQRLRLPGASVLPVAVAVAGVYSGLGDVVKRRLEVLSLLVLGALSLYYPLVALAAVHMVLGHVHRDVEQRRLGWSHPPPSASHLRPRRGWCTHTGMPWSPYEEVVIRSQRYWARLRIGTSNWLELAIAHFQPVRSEWFLPTRQKQHTRVRDTGRMRGRLLPLPSHSKQNGYVLRKERCYAPALDALRKPRRPLISPSELSERTAQRSDSSRKARSCS